MAQDQIKGFFGSQIFTFKAGTLAGIFAGLVEVLFISDFGGKPANLSGLLFAIIAYGILGGAIGKLFNMVLRILPFHADRKNSRLYLGGLITSAVFSFILFLIFFFRAFRDYHAERVGYLEPTGLLTILVLAVIAGALFIVLRLVCVGFLKNILSWMLRPVGYTIVVAAFIFFGLVLKTTLSKETEEVHSAFSDAGQADLKERPSVILIMIDTLRPDWLSCYGREKAVPTPNIDALARESVLFEQMYAHATHTKPSTASLLTSRYPSGHQAIHKTQSLPSSVTTLPEAMAAAGYYCSGIVTNINLAPVYNFQQGFHEYTYLPPKFLFGANEAASRLVVYGVLRLAWMKISSSKFVYHFYRSGETVNGYFNDFIDRNQEKKFFLFLHFMDPHDPYFEHPYSGKGYARASMPEPDPKFVEPFRDFYDQEVQYMDYWIGRLMERLKGEDLYENTLIVFTSDHGEEFNEHGGWWHGTTLHEEQVRVPLLIKLPGSLGGEVKVETLTGSIDVAPTILAAADVDQPALMRGRNLFGPAPSDDFVPTIFSEADHEGNVVQMMRIGPWKYIQTNEDNPRKRPVEQLFYVPDDVWEENNLAGSESDKVTEMQLLMKARYQEILATSEAGAEQNVDAATQERLRALGYTQ